MPHQNALPPIATFNQLNIFISERRSIKITAAIDKYPQARVEAIDQIVSPLILGEYPSVQQVGAMPVHYSDGEYHIGEIRGPLRRLAYHNQDRHGQHWQDAGAPKGWAPVSGHLAKSHKERTGFGFPG